ncbi:hypothetical protein ACOMHN_061749 [Nucella lapillus]
MGLKWTIAFLFSSLVLGSVFGATVRNCETGNDVCTGAAVTASYGDGTVLCCPDGHSISTNVNSVNGATTRSCTCTLSSREWNHFLPSWMIW